MNELINFKELNLKLDDHRRSFQAKKPFKYIVIDNFLPLDVAESIYAAYPSTQEEGWDNTTYINQRNKYEMRKFKPESILDLVSKSFNSSEFLNWMQKLTNIEEELIADDELFGSGLHQSTKGGFLNIHVDYNYHPTTNYHRRLNTLLFMNKEWKEEYKGYLELWNQNDGDFSIIEKISPDFNRLVVFETNEISFHGHPEPLDTPKDITRKSLAFYYYSKSRNDIEPSEHHNTIYVNISGMRGEIKKLFSAGLAAFERIFKK